MIASATPFAPLGASDAILQRAWGAWGRMSKDEIDRKLAEMRGEWERNLPWSKDEP